MGRIVARTCSERRSALNGAQTPARFAQGSMAYRLFYIGVAPRYCKRDMANDPPSEWNGATVRKWLDSRVTASRSDQAAAERAGYSQQDDCDKATAEEMVCTLLTAKVATDSQKTFSNDLRALLDRDDYVWRGVYDDIRFDRHVRSYLRKLIKMTKTNEGFDKTARYQ
jgi:hypothetical protein